MGRAFCLTHSHGSDFSVVLSVIQEKINNPSPDDPFEPDIAAVRHVVLISLIPLLIAVQLLKNDKTKFLSTAKEWTKKYVSPSPS